MAKSGKKPAIVVISSHVARGSVGNRAAVFALETLGFPVWAIPTVILPWHPGHGPATRMMPEDKVFSAFMNDIASSPWLDEVGAVLTGYMGSADQTASICEAIQQMRERNPEIRYVCDPVIGDVGGLYVPEQTASAVRDLLLPLCDVATPNRFELSWLTGQPLGTSPHDCASQAGLLGPGSVLVTSSPGPNAGETGNILFGETEPLAVWHKAMSGVPNGPGDLTAALFLAHSLDGLPDARNLELTTASVLDLLRGSIDRQSDELTLESDTAFLLSPETKTSALRLKG